MQIVGNKNFSGIRYPDYNYCKGTSETLALLGGDLIFKHRGDIKTTNFTPLRLQNDTKTGLSQMRFNYPVLVGNPDPKVQKAADLIKDKILTSSSDVHQSNH